MSSAEASREAGASLDALVDLHSEIDRDAKALAEIHSGRLQCGRGCSGCCLDDLTVTPIEAERIRRAHAPLLENGNPHPPGACAFLDDEGACRVYDDRPYVCRSQGLPLRILYESDAGEIEERRDICSLNLDGGPALEALDEEACWLIGPYELRIIELNARFVGNESRLDAQADDRIALRKLFAKSES